MDFVTEIRTSTSNEALEEVKNLLLETTEASGPFKERMDKLIEYNMNGIPLLGGQLFCYMNAQMNNKASKEDLFQGQILGWLLTFMGLAGFITDDIADKSKTRNGKPCWYLLPEIGKNAVVDSNLIVTYIPLALNHFFGHHVRYKEIVLATNMFLVNSAKGQLMDSENYHKPGSDDIDFERLTWDIFREIVVNKTNFLDVASILYTLSGETNESLHRTLRKLAAYFSLYMQYTNDFQDVFLTDGSTGTDIEEGKLSWCILKALEKASPEQRKTLEENYGKKNKKCVRAVKKVFRELDLKQEFQDLEYAPKEETERLKAFLIQANQPLLADSIDKISSWKQIYPVLKKMSG